MDFPQWVQNHLSNRQWSQADLIRSASARGYLMKSPQLSRILASEQEAGVEYVIAIAHGLGVSRETAFQARGWLLGSATERESSEVSDDVIAVVKEVDLLPPDVRATVLRLIRAVVHTFSRTE